MMGFVMCEWFIFVEGVERRSLLFFRVVWEVSDSQYKSLCMFLCNGDSILEKNNSLDFNYQEMGSVHFTGFSNIFPFLQLKTAPRSSPPTSHSA